MKNKKVLYFTLAGITLVGLAACGDAKSEVTANNTLQAYNMVVSKLDVASSDILIGSSEVFDESTYVVSVITSEGAETYDVNIEEGTTEEVTDTPVVENTNLTGDEAYALALIQSGLTEDVIVKTNISTQDNNGVSLIEVEIYTSTAKYQYVYDVTTKTLKSSKITLLSTSDSLESSYITEEEATSIALDLVNASSDAITELKVKIDRKKGSRVYKVEFLFNDYEYEIVIDAISGTVIKFETEITDSEIEFSTPDLTTLTITEIKEVILTYLSADESLVRFEKIKLNKHRHEFIWEVELEFNNYEYEFEINALTGEIIDLELEEMDDDDDDDDDDDEKRFEFISSKDAYRKAFDKLNIDSNGIYEIDVEEEDGVFVYVVEGKNKDISFKIIIDAKTGEVLESETSDAPSVNEDYITEEEALDIALKHSLFSKDMVIIKKIKLDHDDDETIYEIKFKNNSLEYNYEIDAKTGRILDFEVEYD